MPATCERKSILTGFSHRTYLYINKRMPSWLQTSKRHVPARTCQNDKVQDIKTDFSNYLWKPALVNRTSCFSRSVTPSACKEIFNFYRLFMENHTHLFMNKRMLQIFQYSSRSCRLIAWKCHFEMKASDQATFNNIVLQLYKKKHHKEDFFPGIATINRG